MQALVSLIQTYQLGAYLAGLVVLLAWESFQPFMALFATGRERGLHLLRNLVIGAINAAVVGGVFAGLWVAASAWAEASGFGLMHVLGARWGWPGWAHAAGAILLFDAWTYAWHRLNHRVPFLWRFHRVHHADARMDVSTAGRFHLGEIVLSSLLRLPLIVLIGAYAWELLLYETMMFAVVQFHHANIGLPERVDRALRAVIVTPAMHKVHHSRWQPETDSNYSAFFSFWDRIGRSFRLRKNPREIRFGLDAFEAPDDETLRGMLRMPLRPVARTSAHDPDAS
ncbi:MAG: hypothetical protein KatS3mg042_1053 [Rhodothermaceae bacterium]|nr:MAG: hypothetical protein KatS3mg042_1053 [Rhodothermaceae bacterium]